MTHVLTLLFATTLLLGACGGTATDATDEEAPGPAASAPARQPREIPSGTTLTVELGETISAASSQAGQTFSARIAQPVVVNGETLIPAGAQAQGRVLEATESGRVRGVAVIQLTMTSVSVGGRSVDLSTGPFEARADTSRGEDAATIGVGTGVGAAVGAILGGGDGAALGAAIGGGGGTAVVLTTRGDDIELPAGTAVNFVLNQAVELP
jgi:hypothetical protein